MSVVASIGSTFISVLSISLSYTAPPVEASMLPVHSVAQVINEAAARYGVSSTTMRNIAFSESSGDSLKDNGTDRGLFQISRKHHPEVSDECAFDPVCASNWTAEYGSKHGFDEWVAANCYLFVEVMLHKELPKMKDIKPNTTPHKSAIAVFDYNGVKHLAYVTDLGDNGFTVREANYEPGYIGKRHILWTDPHLSGFYDPQPLKTDTGD